MFLQGMQKLLRQGVSFLLLVGFRHLYLSLLILLGLDLY